VAGVLAGVLLVGDRQLARPVGRPSGKPKAFCHSFWYRAVSWKRERGLVTKVEWHAGGMYQGGQARRQSDVVGRWPGKRLAGRFLMERMADGRGGSSAMEGHLGDVEQQVTAPPPGLARKAGAGTIAEETGGSWHGTHRREMHGRESAYGAPAGGVRGGRRRLTPGRSWAMLLAPCQGAGDRPRRRNLCPKTILPSLAAWRWSAGS